MPVCHLSVGWERLGEFSGTYERSSIAFLASGLFQIHLIIGLIAK